MEARARGEMEEVGGAEAEDAAAAAVEVVAEE
eukprot:COSAG01_NODE_51549_length_354_cov_0.603922_1_plen_31_part_01